jgi:dienelactone hydrolase
MLDNRFIWITRSQGDFDFMGWFIGKHEQAQTRPHLDVVINWLKEQGVKEFFAAGYCFGGA